jgi:hypothetical protein
MASPASATPWGDRCKARLAIGKATITIAPPPSVASAAFEKPLERCWQRRGPQPLSSAQKL